MHGCLSMFRTSLCHKSSVSTMDISLGKNLVILWALLEQLPRLVVWTQTRLWNLCFNYRYNALISKSHFFLVLFYFSSFIEPELTNSEAGCFTMFTSGTEIEQSGHHGVVSSTFFAGPGICGCHWHYLM